MNELALELGLGIRYSQLVQQSDALLSVTWKQIHKDTHAALQRPYRQRNMV